MSHLFTGVDHNVTNFNETQMGEIFGQGIFNVKAYGAMASGSGDNYGAIQNAIDAAIDVAGIVYFPPGTYRYSSTLNITGKVHVLGGGIPRRWTGTTISPELTENSSVILEYTGASIGIKLHNSTASVIWNGTILEGFELRPSVAGAGTDGIVLDAGVSGEDIAITGVILKNVTTKNWGQDGVHTKGTVFDITFDNYSANDNRRYGAYIDNTGAQTGVPSQITFRDIWVVPYSASSDSWGVRTVGTDTIRFFGGTITGYTSAGGGLWLDTGALLSGTHVEGAITSGTIGVRYTGSNGLILEGVHIVNWGIGVQIGNPSSKTEVAKGFVISGEISGNTIDLHLVDGGNRQGVVLHRGYAQTFVVDDDRRTTDTVTNEWFYLGNDAGSIIEFDNGDKISHPETGSGLTFNANWTISDGTWNGGHLVLGTYHLWVDATGDLRIKDGAPSSGTDGAVVGGQS